MRTRSLPTALAATLLINLLSSSMSTNHQHKNKVRIIYYSFTLKMLKNNIFKLIEFKKMPSLFYHLLSTFRIRSFVEKITKKKWNKQVKLNKIHIFTFYFNSKFVLHFFSWILCYSFEDDHDFVMMNYSTRIIFDPYAFLADLPMKNIERAYQLCSNTNFND